VPAARTPPDQPNGLDLRPYTAAVGVNETRSLVILSEAKDLKIRNLRSFAVYAAQDDEWDGVAPAGGDAGATQPQLLKQYIQSVGTSFSARYRRPTSNVPVE
jgi:NAD(P)H-flavin reductase